VPFATGQVFDSNDSCVEFPVFDGGETYFGSRPMLLKNPFTKPPLFALKAFFWIAAPIRGCKAGCLGHFIQFPVLRAQLAR
jgi:hypothetical protein